MRAGRLRYRCSLHKAVRVKNATGGFEQTWKEVTELWADIAIPSGRVEPVAQSLSAEVTAEIRIRTRDDAVVGCRVVRGKTTYLIEASLLDADRTMLRLLCSIVSNP